MKCGKHCPSECHHEPLGLAGMGIKAPDSHCVPLCQECHRLRHDKGVDTFWAGIDIKMKVIGLLTKYLKQKNNFQI